MKENFRELKNELTDCSNLFCKNCSKDDTHSKIKGLGALLFENFKKYSVKK